MDDRLIAQVNATVTSLREAARAANEELLAEQRERDAINARIDQLRALMKQLEEAISQAESTVSAGAVGARKNSARKLTTKEGTRRKSTRKRASSRNGVGRQDAVLNVLAEAEGPMRPAQVAEQLRAGGRSDTSSQVSAALAQLARTDRAAKVGPGLYRKGKSA